MHPKEFRYEKAGTGRLTHLSLPNSEIIVGVEFDDDRRLAALRSDPENHVVLLYPGSDACNLSVPEERDAVVTPKQLVVLVLDATWSCARKMLKLSPSLQRLPRIMFTPSAPSRFVIKRQPVEGCLSTIESVHEVLKALSVAGVERCANSTKLLELFDAMQNFQIACAADPDRGGYRRGAYPAPDELKSFSGGSAKRRSKYFQGGGEGASPPATRGDGSKPSA